MFAKRSFLLSSLLTITLCEKIFISAVVLTREEFNSAVAACGYRTKPKDEVYKYFIKYTGDFTREEAAMLIAQLIFESGGFRHKNQLECQKPSACRGSYDDGTGLPGKSYHGRGYIQLTWAANYRAASLALGLGDRLLRRPELLAEDEELAMLVSVWYWRTRVRPPLTAGEEHGEFGLSTRAINPAECRLEVIARLRYRVYLKVAEALQVARKARENGCYN